MTTELYCHERLFTDMSGRVYRGRGRDEQCRETLESGAIGQINKPTFNKSRRCQGRWCRSCVQQRGLLSKRRPGGRVRRRQWRRS